MLTANSTPSPAPEPSHDRAVACGPVGFAGTLVLLAAALLAYWPVVHAGFVWDDAAHVTAPHLRSWSGLQRIWTEPGATQQYYPLLHSLFWLEHRCWGDAALGYHLAALAWHMMATCLFALLLRRLAIGGAFFAALFFALHPVHVESVAWISEQKNTLSTVFYLASALAWLRFDAHRRPLAYLAASLFFCAALLTKTVTATLPAALLVLAWWQRGAISWRRDVLPLLPWFALAAAAGIATAWFERKLIGAEGAAFDFSFGQRALLSGRLVWFYLGKLVWPAGLSFVYPRWPLSISQMAAWLPLIGALVVTLALWRWRGRTRAPLAAWLCFGGALFPVLGFLNVYPFRYAFAADHFQYLASLGPIALAGAAIAHAARRAMRCWVGALLCVALGLLAASHARVFRDSETLFRATVRTTPSAWMAHNNLGEVLMKNPATRAEAIACFERALALQPDYFEARNNLGLALTQAGRAGDALPQLTEAVRLKPQSFEAHNNLGIALAGSGRAPDALEEFRRAAAINPVLPNIQENWAKALVLLGRRAEADAHFALAARLRAAAPRAR